MEIPYWYRLLVYFDRKRYFNNGLTIPYLIGARSILEPDKTALTISQFIKEASTNELPKPITIIKCNQINEWVIGVIDSETEAIRKTYKNLYKEIDKIIFPDQFFKNFNSVDELITNAQTIYQPIIDSGGRSKNHGQWGNYTEQEEERIKEVLNE